MQSRNFVDVLIVVNSRRKYNNSDRSTYIEDIKLHIK